MKIGDIDVHAWGTCFMIVAHENTELQTSVTVDPSTASDLGLALLRWSTNPDNLDGSVGSDDLRKAAELLVAEAEERERRAP